MEEYDPEDSTAREKLGELGSLFGDIGSMAFNRCDEGEFDESFETIYVEYKHNEVQERYVYTRDRLLELLDEIEDADSPPVVTHMLSTSIRDAIDNVFDTHMKKPTYLSVIEEEVNEIEKLLQIMCHEKPLTTDSISLQRAMQWRNEDTMTRRHKLRQYMKNEATMRIGENDWKIIARMHNQEDSEKLQAEYDEKKEKVSVTRKFGKSTGYVSYRSNKGFVYATHFFRVSENPADIGPMIHQWHRKILNKDLRQVISEIPLHDYAMQDYLADQGFIAKSEVPKWMLGEEEDDVVLMELSQ